MNQISKIQGVSTLSKEVQKSVFGGRRSSSNCAGQPNGTRCFNNGHKGCPGECYGGSCMVY